ncbi:NUDIX hydrolase [Peribacillus sp. SCS-37]|uniref:NUDIX hydrolase n=1 Tax=Paraperibacillus esterisolvens TaxID=3115296 RepID=UPI0039058E17
MDYIRHLRSMVGHERVLMVTAGVFVFDEKNRLLLQKRSDNGQWGLPGGFMELDEDIQTAATREVLEETGLKVSNLELFGIYSGPRFNKTFANGDQVSLLQILFISRSFTGSVLERNEESIENGFFSLDKLPDSIFTDHMEFINDMVTKGSNGEVEVK